MQFSSHHASRITHHASRITHHASRITHHVLRCYVLRITYPASHPTLPLKIAISLGDVTGIGPEVALKALARAVPQDAASFILIGDSKQVLALDERLGTRLPLAVSGAGGGPHRIEVVNPLGEPLPRLLTPGAPEAARAAVAWVRAGAEGCLRHQYDALVTAPVNKESIIRAGVAFVGQTELLSEIAATQQTAMMLLGQNDRDRWLRVVLATTHVPLKAVSERLTKEKIELAITLADRACRQLGLARQRIGVCGLNPHAGEGGAMGTEELTTIGPAVADARRRNLDAVGPLSADALFHYAYRGDYDVVVAMYHDQGLAPLKLIAFERGVNWTLGLPFVRTSPDHGTAYDIAGANRASPTSMEAAIQLAIQLAGRALPGVASRPGAAGAPT